MDDLVHYSMMVASIHDNRYCDPAEIVKCNASPNTITDDMRELIETSPGSPTVEQFFGADYYSKFPDVLVAEQK
jgi:hypothetical protein